MALSDNYKPVKYIGNGTTRNFTFDFNMTQSEYCRVFLENIKTGKKTSKVIDVDYNLKFDDAGGTVEMITPPTAEEYIVIYRKTKQDQNSAFLVGESFPAERIEDAFDKSMSAIQELQDAINRSPQVSEGVSVNLTLPNPEAKKAIVWNEAGDGFENSNVDFDQVEAETKRYRDEAEGFAIAAENSQIKSETEAVRAEAAAQNAENSAQSAVNTVNGFDAHAEEAKNNFDRNYNDKLVAFNINAVDKQNDFDTNAATLTARYDNNDLAKTKAFNENAQTMTDGYNQNAMLKIDDFDAHYTIKEMEFDDHAAIKQGEVDASASKAKQSELNAATSEANAKASENNAKNSENASGISEDNARESERLAREHKEAAQLSETNAKTSEDNAAMSASDAKLSAQASALSEQSAKDSADKATKAVANIDVDIARAETAATNAEKFANGTIEEYPEGSAKYWKDQAQAIVGSGQMLLDVDQDVNSSKTFLKDQAIKSPDLDIRNDRSKRGNGLIFTDKNGTQTAGIGIYINNNQSPECRFVASNGNKSAFAGLGVTTDGQGFFEIPEPSDTSNNNDAVSSRWVNKKVNTKQDKLSTAQIIATNSGITAAKVETYDGYNVTIDGKQAQLNAAQLNAVNSGITSAKVSTYDGYKALIDGKQPAGNYQTVGNLSQTLDASVSKYPSNKAVATAIANIDLTSRADTNLSNLSQAGKDVIINEANNISVGFSRERFLDNVSGAYTIKLQNTEDIITVNITGNATITFDFSGLIYPEGKPFFTACLRFGFPAGVKTIAFNKGIYINGNVPDFSNGKTHMVVIRKHSAWNNDNFLISDAGSEG